MRTVNFLMFKLVLENAEEPEIKLPTFAGSWKKAREFQKKPVESGPFISPVSLRFPTLEKLSHV